MTDFLAPSPLDSDRFGMRIARGRGDTVTANQLLAEILAMDCDIAIIRLPTSVQAPVAALARRAMQVLHCDTLVYYGLDLRTHEPRPLRNADLDIRLARADDLAALKGLIAHTFVGYRSHYNGNPLLDPDAILAGYQQWGEGFLHARDGLLWVATLDGELVAFAACAESAGESTGEGVLYGVSPSAAGKGIYGDLIRHTQADFKRRGFATMKVSTQVGNFAVQKVWAREGFAMAEAWDTYHVNALMHAGETGYSDVVTFRQEDVDAFARATGDGNPLHLDAAAAARAGFDGTIAHGVMGAGEISRVLGTVVPGAGTILTHMDLAFLRPVTVGQPHRLTLRFVGGRRASGPMLAIARLDDASGAACLLGRADIVLKG